MKRTIIFLIITISLLLTSCAASLTSTEKVKYNEWQSNGELINEKSPGLGIALGLLPGFGSFYVREPVYGVLNLLTWPLSILWDPVSGYHGSQSINFQTTLAKENKKKDEEIHKLEIRKIKENLTDSQFLIEKMSIQEKYNQ